MTPTIQCSHCGKRRYVSLYCNQNGVTNIAHKWKSCGSTLYCPKCAKDIKNYAQSYESNLINILEAIDRHYELVPKQREA